MLAAGAQWTVRNEEGTVASSTVHAPATAQEGEAYALITYVLVAAALPPGTIVWIIVDSESSAAALKAYIRNPRTKGMMSQIYAQAIGYEPLELSVAINILVVPSHRFTMVNAWADFATRLRPSADGSRMFRRYFHIALPEPYQQQYQLGPKALRKYLHAKAGKALATVNRAEFGEAWKPSREIGRAHV